MSTDQEVALGEQNAAEINARLPLLHDSAVDRYVAALGDSIAAHTSRPELPWHFTVVNSAEVNAFAIPGGFVYVNRGLIEHADKMDELAGVLGHEIGHVIRRHSVKQIQQGERAQVGVALLCTLTNACRHAAGRVAIGVGGTALMARHSRQDETEADDEAVRNVVAVGIDPQGIPEFFRKLIAERAVRPGLVEGFFASHPLEEARVADTERLIANIDSTRLRGLVQDSPEFHAVQRRLRELPPPPAVTAPPDAQPASSP